MFCLPNFPLSLPVGLSLFPFLVSRLSPPYILLSSYLLFSSFLSLLCLMDFKIVFIFFFLLLLYLFSYSLFDFFLILFVPFPFFIIPFLSHLLPFLCLFLIYHFSLYLPPTYQKRKKIKLTLNISPYSSFYLSLSLPPFLSSLTSCDPLWHCKNNLTYSQLDLVSTLSILPSFPSFPVPIFLLFIHSISFSFWYYYFFFSL